MATNRNAAWSYQADYVNNADGTFVPGTPPYYDEFDPSNNYVSLLFNPGVSLQNRELNELQSTIAYRIKQIADTMLTDGDIVEGCQLIIPEGNFTPKECTITEGKLYLNGMVRELQTSKVTITGIGVERIGVKVIQKVVTSNQSSALLDPAQGYANYLRPGSDRLKETLLIVLNDETAATMFLLQDGQLVNSTVNENDTIYDKINVTLARRTFNESGNYKVSGLSLFSKNQTDKDHLYVSISDGIAYVKGYEIYKNTATTIPLDRSVDTRSIISEPKVFTTGTTKYALNNIPVSQINRVIAVIQVTTNMTRQGSISGSDPIPSQYTPAVDIQQISQPSISKTYVKNVDYILQSDTVKWLEGENSEPDLGSTYQITFTYNRTMVQGVDYDLFLENGNYYVRLLEGGETPVSGSAMQVDYDFMLYYIAVLTMDRTGLIRVVRGPSDNKANVAAPNLDSQDNLILGQVLLIPKSDALEVSDYNNKRLSMEDLQKLYSQVIQLQENMAITSLDSTAMNTAEPTALKGIYTDSFFDFSRCDVNHALFNSGIDMFTQELTMSQQQTPNTLIIKDPTDISPIAAYKKYGQVVLAPATETMKLEQAYATAVSLINPYSVFPESPNMEISPTVDNWLDTESVTIRTSGGSVTLPDKYILSGKNYGSNSNWALQNVNKNTSVWESVDTATQTIETAVTWMRPTVISLVGKKFASHQNNLRVTFNDLVVSATPLTSAYQGDTPGCLKADANGVTKGSFTVPGNVRCGTVQVKLFPIDKEQFVANAAYTATGLLRTTTTTLTTTVYSQSTITQSYKYVDPVSQTFFFKDDQILNSIGLYFCKKDSTNPITIQIRDTVNGYPGTTIYAEKVIDPVDIKPSDDSSLETIITLDNPVYLQAGFQYAITILTESNTDSLYYAALGGKDLLTGAQVIKNPYAEGMMFTSSNAIAWSEHQTWDLKFRVYVNDFKTDGYVYFQEIQNVSFSSVSLFADMSVPVDTSLQFEYSQDSGRTWYPIAVNTPLEFSYLCTKIMIRAHMIATGNKSPAFNIDSILLVGYLNDTECNYVMRNVQTDSKFNKVKQIVSVKAPTGTGVIVYYSTDVNGTNWFTGNQTGSKVLEDNGYTQYTYEAELSTEVQNFRARIGLTTNNPCVIPHVKDFMNIMTTKLG